MIGLALGVWHLMVLCTNTICVFLIAINTTPAVAVILASMALAHDQLYRLTARARKRAIARSRTRWVVPFRVPSR